MRENMHTIHRMYRPLFSVTKRDDGRFVVSFTDRSYSFAMECLYEAADLVHITNGLASVQGQKIEGATQ